MLKKKKFRSMFSEKGRKNKQIYKLQLQTLYNNNMGLKADTTVLQIVIV